MTRREREITDLRVIRTILEQGKYLHLALVDDGMPYVLPMNYGFTLDGDKLTLYLHCAVKGYKLDVIAKNPACAFALEGEVMPFAGEIACQYGNAYSSVMGRGRVEVVADVEEKKEAMSILMKTQTGKDFTFNDRLVSIVTVLKIDVTEFTAKRRPLPKEE